MEREKKVRKSWSSLFNFTKKKDKPQTAEDNAPATTKLKKKSWFRSTFNMRDKYRRSKDDIQVPEAVIQVTPPTPEITKVIDSDTPKVQTVEQLAAPTDIQTPQSSESTEPETVATATVEPEESPERKSTPTEDKPTRLSTLGRVLTTNIPFVSWFRTTSTNQDNSNIVNPILHLATVSMNMSEMKDNEGYIR